MKIDDKLKGIKQYVLTMRYQDNLSIVDVQLKNGWKVPQSKIFGIKPYGGEYPNTYMFYSDKENVGIDDILSFVEDIVKVNIERENKMALLTEKSNELKNFFMKHSLSELERLKFVITEEEDVMPFDAFTPSKIETATFVSEDGRSEKVVTRYIEEPKDMPVYEEESVVIPENISPIYEDEDDNFPDVEDITNKVGKEMIEESN